MRTRILVVGIASVLGTIVLLTVGLRHHSPKAALSEYLPESFVSSVVVADSKSVHRSKDAELFWQLTHSAWEVGPILLGRGFRLSDKADKTWVQQSLAEVFRDGFLPDGADSVFSRDTPGFDVFVLTTATGTNSFVMVLKK